MAEQRHRDDGGRRLCRADDLSRTRSTQCPIERGGREVLDRQREDVAVGAEALECPGQGGLDWDADRATGGDDAEQGEPSTTPG